MQTIKCDVLVIGGGGAALRAALAAVEADPACSVVLLTKGELGKSGVTARACSDRMAFHATLPYTEPGGPENWRFHAEDIYRIGGFVSDGDLATVLAKNAADAFAYLDALGVPFVKKDDGTADQFVTDGSKYARACYTGPHTANHIEEALVNAASDAPIDVFENTAALDLVIDGGQCCGAVGVDHEGGLIYFKAGATVLATGGAGRAFAVNVFPEGMTGDGAAMALRAGAELVNMEFIQIGLSSLKTSLACSGSMFRAIPRVVDAGGVEILPEVFPDAPGTMLNTVFRKGASWPISFEEPSYAIDVAVFRKIADGGRVFLDYASNPDGYSAELLDESIWKWYAEKDVDLADVEQAGSPLQRLEQINAPAITWLAARGIDLRSGSRIEIAPAIQHFQGGVKIRTKAETCVPGLFAAGEAAGGQHGANRPGGNALMDCQVFGKIAGSEAAAFAGTAQVGASAEGAAVAICELLQAELERGKLKPQEAAERAGAILSRCASVVRTSAAAEDGLKQLAELRAAGITGGDALVPACEARNIFDVAQAVLKAIAMRRESRGPHLCFAEEDAPEPLPRDEQWQKYLVISGTGSTMTIEAKQPASPEAASS